MAPAILVPIAICESGINQYNDKGEVLRNPTNPHVVGIFQISTYWHSEEAKALGYDLLTPKGNIAFALWLFHKEGTKPWNASKLCWGKP